jgi:hypothetical protein
MKRLRLSGKRTGSNLSSGSGSNSSSGSGSNSSSGSLKEVIWSDSLEIASGKKTGLSSPENPDDNSSLILSLSDILI